MCGCAELRRAPRFLCVFVERGGVLPSLLADFRGFPRRHASGRRDAWRHFARGAVGRVAGRAAAHTRAGVRGPSGGRALSPIWTPRRSFVMAAETQRGSAPPLLPWSRKHSASQVGRPTPAPACRRLSDQRWQGISLYLKRNAFI